MQDSFGTLESHQKVQEFKNEIRSRIKNDYMKKIRYQFLSLEQSSNRESIASTNSLIDLAMLLSQQPNKTTVSKINKMLIDLRQNLTENHVFGLINYINQNLLNKPAQQLLQKLQINDLIALFGNIMAINKPIVQLEIYIDFQRALKLMIVLLQSASNATGDLILWILFQLTQIIPNSAIQQVSALQLPLRDRFGISNINLSYLICSIAESRPDLINPKLIEQYTSINMTNQSKKYFCQNLSVIFNSYMKVNKNASFTDKLINWISIQLSSAHVDGQVKSNLLKILLNIIKQHLNLSSLMGLLANSPLIYELLQRSMFDNIQLKTICIIAINEIVKNCPQMQIQQLLSNYPSVIQVLVSSLSLLQHHIVISSLISIGKIIALRPNDRSVRDMFINAGLQLQLEVLRASKNKQVQTFASAILENYLEQ